MTEIIQKILIVVAVLIAFVIVGLGAYRYGRNATPPPQADREPRYLIFHMDTGDAEQTTDERYAARYVRNKRVRIFDLEPEQVVEDFLGTSFDPRDRFPRVFYFLVSRSHELSIDTPASH